VQIDPLTLKRAQKGNQNAFETILSAHERMIYGICLRMTGNRDDAMDVSQETAVRVWRNIGRFSGEAALSTWIYRIATNACLDHLRKRRDTLSVDEMGEGGYAPAAPATETPEGALGGKETLREVERALTQLPEDQRAAVVLRDVQDLSYEEVARVLGVNLNTVKSRISRGRKNLRDLLGSHEELLQKSNV
jgi:RNA polymerase sigma-70 factor (ECF subfamily)